MTTTVMTPSNKRDCMIRPPCEFIVDLTLRVRNVPHAEREVYYEFTGGSYHAVALVAWCHHRRCHFRRFGPLCHARSEKGACATSGRSTGAGTQSANAI